jgi:hypothetical protein
VRAARPARDQPGDAADTGGCSQHDQHDPDELGQVLNAGFLGLDRVDHGIDGEGEHDEAEHYAGHPDLHVRFA